MLILFDIDGTLLTTSRAGIAALRLAGIELFGSSFTTEGVDFAGRLDPLIIDDLLAMNLQARTAELARAMRDGYRRHLEALLSPVNGESVSRACPGVHELVAALGADASLTLGLLTGNFADTGEFKLRSAGIDPRVFSIRVWGDESPHIPARRDHLPPIGMRRFAERHGRAVRAGDVTIIGDTPHDVSCARAHGCRSLGVATGMFSVAQLVESGADHAVETLSDTHRVVEWIVRAGG